MKLLRLNLLRFGPFENYVLDFHGGEQGLHVVYGPNEAGKTSALRALRQALYGIDHNSADNFNNIAYPDLRVGATIQGHDGRVVDFIRRKGQKNTLRGADDESILDPAELANCLIGAEDDGLFSKRFGIDYRGLGEGGALVDQSRGSLGELLFAAASGVTDLAQIERRLQQEADELFVPRGSKPRLNRACAEYSDVAKRLKQARIPAAEGAQRQSELEGARAECDGLERLLNDKRSERERLGRFEQAFRLLALRSQLQNELKEVQDAVLLPDEFEKEHLVAMTALRQAESNEQAAVKELTALDQSIEEVAGSTDVLEHESAIEALVQQLGGYRTAREHRPGLVSRRQLRETDAQRILRNVTQRETGPDEAEAMRLSPDQKVRLQELAQDRGGIVARREACAQQLEALKDRERTIAKELEAQTVPQDFTELERAVRRLQQQGNLERRWHDLQRQLDQAREQVDIDLSNLTLWSGELTALEKLPVPAVQTLDEFEQEFRGIEAEQKKVRERLTEIEGVLAEFDRQLAELDLQYDVPSEVDLDAARRRRDLGWQLVLQAWQSGIADDSALFEYVADAPNGDLASAYRHDVEQSDRIADRLRYEADRVSKKASLLAGKTKATSHRETLQGQRRGFEDSAGTVKTRWTSVWKPLGIEPLSPREMRAWFDRHTKLAAASHNIRGLESNEKELASLVRQHFEDIQSCMQRLRLPATDHQSISMLLETAECVLDDLRQQREQRQRASDELDRTRLSLPNAERALRQADKELTEWEVKWANAIGRMRLSPQATPAEALAVVAALEDYFEKRQQADSLGERIDGIDRDEKLFVASAQTLAEQLAPDLRNESVQCIVESLQSLLKEAREKCARRDEIAKKRIREEGKLELAQSAVRDASAALAALCQLAGCADANQLTDAAKQSSRRKACERELRNVMDQLLTLAAGIELDEFIDLVQAQDPVQLRPRQEQLEREIEIAQGQQSELNQKIGDLSAQLRQLGGPSPSQEAEGEKLNLLARIEHDAERFARLHLARIVLNRAMERYRERNQGPILAKAGEIFAVLTLGSFTGLRTHFDDSGSPVVRGIRTDTKMAPVGVEGMSDGTKDQLYLSLRLASLDHYLSRNKPFPFIVDDILIKFDDERAIAALKALAHLSERTQVIFFTHHRRLVELAQKHLSDWPLFTHELNCRRNAANTVLPIGTLENGITPPPPQKTLVLGE